MPNFNKAYEGTTGPSTKNIIEGAGNLVKLASATVGKNSLTRMAGDSIFKFPLIISSSIESSDIEVIAKAFEKQYASLLVSAISLNNTVDITKFPNSKEFLNKFHSNKDIPLNIRAATNFVLESATIDPASYNTSDVALEAWSTPDTCTDREILNDVYRPFERSKSQLIGRIEMSKATENKADTAVKKISDMGKEVARYSGDFIGDPSKDRKSIANKILDNKRPIIDDKSKFEIVRNDKFTAMEPTMLNVTLVFTGNGTMWPQNVVLGVKSLIRLVRSDLLVSNMIEASRGSNIIFKFIKWVNGEFKFLRDGIFGITDAIDDAKKSNTNSRWLSALKRRKNADTLGKLTQNRVPPDTTIVITKYEASQIASECGVDLTKIFNALSIISKYYLLAFAIYDTETKILSTVFDGETDFGDATISSLRGGNDKNNNAMDAKEMLKLMGRI